MRHYCTYFDQNYLPRGLALHHSLVRSAGDFELVVLCMDEAVEAALRKQKLPRLRLLPVAELVGKYPALAAARANRTKLEFYFTCTSWLMQHLLPQLPAGELLTYLDSDLYFFSSPQPVFDEIGAASVAITPHRFPASLVHLERYGIYNVGWVSLRHDATGLACAADWAGKCAEWCFNLLEADRYADQKYLDAWSEKFPGTVSLRHPGVNAAPWNIKDAKITSGQQGVQINGQALVFYHFHALVDLGRQLYDPCLYRYDAELTPGLRELVYLPYLRQLLGPTTEAPELLPPVRADDPRIAVALPYLLKCIQAAELDSARRLESVHIITQDRDRAETELRQTVVLMRDVEQKSLGYLREVEQDSADRLASIQFHQDKLKTAYDDLARNVAYLKTLEAEIAAHVKVSADKDAIIADLAAKLEVASKSP